jgi:PAS domain S-box-containing protein
VDDADRARHCRSLTARREAIAQRWQDALAPTSFVPHDWDEVRRRLLALTGRAIAALIAVPFDANEGQAIGAALASLHYTTAAAVGVTHRVLGQELVAGLAPDQLAALHPTLLDFLGALSEGFFTQVSVTILANQETIRDALLAERQRAEAAMRDSELRFRSIFEQVPFGIGLSDMQGQFLEINPVLQQLLGYGGEELRGRPFTDFVHPDDLAVGWHLHGELIAGQRDRYAMDERFFRKDGAVVWGRIAFSVVRDSEGRPQFVIGAGVDVTEHMQQQAVLAEQYRAAEAAQGETRAILDATGEAMLLIAPDGTILAVNQRFGEFFLLREEQVRGRPFADFQAEFRRILGDPAAVARIAQPIADPEARFTMDLAQVWPVERALECFTTPVLAAGDRRLGRLYAFRDVTREREVDRLKSEFVSLVSHELRTPLTSIKGYVDLLLADEVGELRPEQREFLEIVRQNSDRLIALIEDLLDISRVESGQIALRCTAMDISRVIGEVAASFRPQVLGKKQRLLVRVPEGLPAVWGDTERVTQILTNLVSNAHKYTPAGGRITVAVRPEDGRVRIDVRDTGIGLSASEQAQLFTRFFRAKNRTTQEVGGTGLGLVITRSLVERHGGYISVASELGNGSTFTVTLPTALAVATASEAADLQ